MRATIMDPAQCGDYNLAAVIIVGWVCLTVGVLVTWLAMKDDR